VNKNFKFFLVLFILCGFKAHPINTRNSPAIENSFTRGQNKSYTVKHASNLSSDIFLLKIDFSQKTTPVQSGFQGYIAGHEVANTFVSQSFQVEGNTRCLKS
jgi:hypothetical protein